MTEHHPVPTLAELKNARPILRNPVREAHLSLSPLERFAVYITKHVGSMGFFIILACWTFGWLLWNLAAPLEYRFDPAPAFVIWLFISNMIQLILLPLVMVGQNLDSKVSDIRAKADYEVNEKAEREIEAVLAHLENHDEMLNQLLKK